MPGPSELLAAVTVISPWAPKHTAPFPVRAPADQHLTTQMLLVADDSVQPVQAELCYRTVDPFAVELRVSLARSPAVSWTFSRDLLIAGISHPSGIGDVRIYPGGDGLLIELRSTAAVRALLLADRRYIEWFVGQTMSTVPIGSEIAQYDLDAQLIRLATDRDPNCGG